MEPFANINDVMTLFRPLQPEEARKAEAFLPIVSDELRTRAKQYGRDLDAMIVAEPALASVAKRVTVDIIGRALRDQTDANSGVMSQMSQSALGYTISGTLANPGGGLYIKNAELDALGLRRQRIGGLDIYGTKRNHD